MNKDFLINVVNYIIEGHTIIETANYFNKSVSSIKKYLKEFRTSASESDKILLEKLNLTLRLNEAKGKIKGGENGKRGKSYADFTARMYARAYLSGYTIEELSEISHIPSSTLHDMIRGIDDDELQDEIDEYVRGKR